MLAVEIKSTKNVNELKCEMIILPTPFSANSSNLEIDFNIFKTNKLIGLNVDKIILEEELNDLKEYLKESLSWNIDYYLFSDMSVYYILYNLGVKNKFIFDAKTLNCSMNDVKSYNKLGISCLISTELTAENVTNISTIENNAFLVYGHSNIFYSKRKLMSLYSDYKQIKIDLDKDYSIIEETRKENYPICENKNGTFIYTPYRYYLFNELNNINKNNIFIINNFQIKEDELIKICAIYDKVLNYGATDELLNELIKINDNLGQSFLYLKPSILKEDNND